MGISCFLHVYLHQITLSCSGLPVLTLGLGQPLASLSPGTDSTLYLGCESNTSLMGVLPSTTTG